MCWRSLRKTPTDQEVKQESWRSLPPPHPSVSPSLGSIRRIWGGLGQSLLTGLSLSHVTPEGGLRAEPPAGRSSAETFSEADATTKAGGRLDPFYSKYIQNVSQTSTTQLDRLQTGRGSLCVPLDVCFENMHRLHVHYINIFVSLRLFSAG